MKQKLKKIFPVSIIAALAIEYFRDYFRYVKHSGVFYFVSDNQNKLLGNIIADYHVIEKGLTMPERRLGFGKEKLIKLIEHCEQYIRKYGAGDRQLQQAVAVINEYVKFHADNSFQLDQKLMSRADELSSKVPDFIPSQQLNVTASEYFSENAPSFEVLARSRRSVRNYSDEPITKEEITNAVELAVMAPSSCNRQASRVHVYEDRDLIKKILEIQGGNRGFGHLATKLLIVTAELGASHGVYERNMAYVDGGIFAMNLLNGLHFNRILACPLNCYFSSWKDKKLRELCGIKKSEVFVLMISCGKAKENFDIPQSYRYPVEEFVSFK